MTKKLNRNTLVLCGESGTGLVSTGEIISSAFKKMGYFVTTEREFPSLIKGGRSNFKINFSNKMVRSVATSFQIGVAFDVAGLEECLDLLGEGSVLIHGFERMNKLRGFEKKCSEKGIHLAYLPARTIALEQGGSEIMSNMVLLAILWKVLEFNPDKLKEKISEIFASKPQLLEIDLRVFDAAGVAYSENFQTSKIGDSSIDSDSLEENPQISTKFDPLEGVIMPNSSDGEVQVSLNNQKIDQSKTIFLEGNQAIALGAIHAGVRGYFAYPMSPASSILSYISKVESKTGMVVKQAEDEITAAQMAFGAMHAGARAFTATSGGGFDLMTETVSLSGITEVPLVIVIAQRPGPATGLPTWTAQADLNLAIYGGHGEFARVVMSGSDPVDCYEGIQHAFNLAEKYQVPVIFLTEKAIAEAKMTVPEFRQGHIPIERGLVEGEELNFLKREDRFKITEDGVSKRWIPGSSETTYFANGDEHHEDGTLDESEGAGEMIAKRIRKLETIQKVLPEPEIFGEEVADFSFVGWGSSKNAVLDAIDELAKEGIKLNYLHLTYLHPLKTEAVKSFFQTNKNVHLIEGNNTGQLGEIIEAKTGFKFKSKFLKWNGRTFKVDEVVDYVKNNS